MSMEVQRSGTAKYLFVTILTTLLNIFIAQTVREYANVLIAHGYLYPNNDIYDGNQSLLLSGTLTSVGHRQMYLLGSYMHEKYMPFINPRFDSKQSMIRSLYNARSMQSSQAFCLGFFQGVDGYNLPNNVAQNLLDPPFEPLKNQAKHNSNYIQSISKDQYTNEGKEEFEYRISAKQSYKLRIVPNLFEKMIRKELSEESALMKKQRREVKKVLFSEERFESSALTNGFQPIPVLPSGDSIFNNCPNSGILLTQRLREISTQLSQLQLQHSPLIAKMKLIFNLTPLQSSVQGMRDLYETLLRDLALAKDIPKDVTQTDLKELRFISEYFTAILNGGDYGRIISIPFIRELTKTLKTSRETRKFDLNFVDIGTIDAIARVLNLTSETCLQQVYKNQTVTDLNCVQINQAAQNLEFELLIDDSYEESIEVHYNGEKMYLCSRQLYYCQLDEFVSRLLFNLPDFEKLCGIK